MIKNYFYFLLISFYFSFIDCNRLVFLYTHFRHGARGPTELDDNFNDKLGEKWESLGELTGVGERMHYLLGLRNRKKYIEQEKFLSEKFDPHQMLIFTSAVNRTMISCYSQLQGLYPQSVDKGETLSLEQEEKAYPPVLDEIKEKDADIEKAKTELGKYALPYSMMLAPARMININEIRMNIADSGKCGDKVINATKNNLNVKEFQDFIFKFNQNYAEKLNKYYNKEKAEFNFLELNYICDNFLCDYTENRTMKDFKDKTGLDFEEFKGACFDFIKNIYIYGFHGDEEKIFSHVESSKFFREILYYMKRRLDADITEIDEDANYKDYSRPRYIMKSGHDTTVSADIVLLMKALDINIKENLKYPRFASQFVLEVRTNLDKCKTYSDYYVVGIHDNTEIFNINAEEFMNKVEKEIWTDKQVDEYCEINSNDNGNNDDNKIKFIYKILLIVFICLTVAFMISTIVLGVKLHKSKNSIPLTQDLDGIEM